MSLNAGDITRILGAIGDFFGGGGMKRGIIAIILGAIGLGAGSNEIKHQIKKRRNNNKQQEKEDIK